jgi:hypothetical protein
VSTPDKPDLARGWQFIEKLLAADDPERLDQASDEEVERQMREQGVHVSRVPSVEELMARVAERAAKRNERAGRASAAKVKSLPRSRWVPWVVGAALCILLVLLVVQRRQIIAWFTRDSMVAPDDWQNEKLVRQERVDALRREGFEACAESMWTQCEGKLDEAKRLDPGGEADPRVRAAREAIDDARRPRPRPLTTPDPKK